MKRTIFLPKLHRTVATQIRANEPGEDGRKSWRTVFSTEREVEREDWWTGKKWIEILGHNKSEVDLDRAGIGLPVLENHDSRQHIGVGRNVRIEKKQLVADTSFSRRAAGADLEQDVLDGIKGSTSVGYIPHSMKLVETRDDDVDVYRVTRWTPYEYSFVPMPADIDSAVDRTKAELFPVEVEIEDDAERVMEEAAMFRGLFADPSLPRHRMEEPPDRPKGAPEPREERTEPAPPARVGPDDASKRVAAIAKQYKMDEHLAGWIEKGLTPDQAAQETMRLLEERATKALAQPPSERLVDLDKRDVSKYSVFRALKMAAGIVKREGLEAEVSNDLEKQARADGIAGHGGVYVLPVVGADPERRQAGIIARRMSRAGMSHRIMTTFGAATGADMVFDTPGELIDLLREQMVLDRAGVQTMLGVVGPVAFPKKTTALTAFAMGEAPAAGVTESTLGTALVTAAAKTAMAMSRITRQFLNQQDIVGEAMIRSELSYAHAYYNDNEGINGNGAAGHSLGILNTPGVVDDGDGTGTGGVSEFKNFTSLAAKVRKANALAPGFSWLATPETAGVLMTVPQIAAAGAERLWQGTFDEGSVAGYPARVSNLLPTNVGTDADGHAVIGGAWAEGIRLFWGGFEIVVNPFSEDTSGIIRITSYQETDIIFRHPEAFRFMNCDLS